jgi:hypothetical protein
MLVTFIGDSLYTFDNLFCEKLLIIKHLNFYFNHPQNWHGDCIKRGVANKTLEGNMIRIGKTILKRVFVGEPIFLKSNTSDCMVKYIHFLCNHHNYTKERLKNSPLNEYLAN